MASIQENCKLYAYFILDALLVENLKEIVLTDGFAIKLAPNAVLEPRLTLNLGKAGRDAISLDLGSPYVLEYQQTIDKNDINRIKDEEIFPVLKAGLSTLQLYKSRDVGASIGFTAFCIGDDNPETALTGFRSFRIGNMSRVYGDTYPITLDEINKLKMYWQDNFHRVLTIEREHNFLALPLARYCDLPYFSSLENRLVESVITFEMLFSEYNDSYQTQLYATVFLSNLGENWEQVWKTLGTAKQIRNSIVHYGEVKRNFKADFPLVAAKVQEYLRMVLSDLVERGCSKKELLQKIKDSIINSSRSS